MELFKDTHLVKLELLSNTTTIDSALNYIINKQQQPQQSQQQQQQKRQLALDSTSNDNSDSQLTTTGRQTPIIIHNTYFGPSKILDIVYILAHSSSDSMTAHAW